MSSEPEDIRTDIERTREDLSRDVDALSEKVSPASATRRQVERMRHRMSSITGRVMGSAEESRQSAGAALGSAREGARDTMAAVGDKITTAPETVRASTQGNPIAAGLVAFGAGLLAASLMPSSRPEQEAAARVRSAAAPLVDDVKETASSAAQNLQGSAKEGMQAVQETAQDAFQGMTEEGRSTVSGVKDEVVPERRSEQDG